MSDTPGNIRILIPLKLRRRNGRARILPPADPEQHDEALPDPRLFRAIARAWSWRRKLENGAATTIGDLAAAEKLSDRFVSRRLRLAYLAPEVLEQLLIRRRPAALSIDDISSAAQAPWSGQPETIFEA